MKVWLTQDFWYENLLWAEKRLDLRDYQSNWQIFYLKKKNCKNENVSMRRIICMTGNHCSQFLLLVVFWSSSIVTLCSSIWLCLPVWHNEHEFSYKTHASSLKGELEIPCYWVLTAWGHYISITLGPVSLPKAPSPSHSAHFERS